MSAKLFLRGRTALPAILAFAATTPAFAQEPAQPAAQQEAVEDSASGADIVVTARRRDERLQDVPAAISALGAEQLEQYAITSVTDAAKLVPQLIVSKSTSGTGATVYLRGVGTSSLSAGYDQSIGINVDNVQINRGNAIYIGYLDMGQFEVLKGPQALYFGKNSPGGVISISSRNPTRDAEFTAMAGYEIEARQIYGEAVASGPVSDTLLLRAAVRYSNEDGFFHNVATPFQHPNGLAFPGALDKRYPGTEEYSGRLTAIFEPSDSFTLKAKAFYGNLHGQPAARDIVYCRGVNPTPVFGIVNTADDCKLDRNLTAGGAPVAFTTGNPTASKDGRPLYTSEVWLLSADATYDAGPVSINSITAFYDNRAKNYVSFWGGVIFGSDLQNYRAFSEELRISTDLDGPINFVAGGFYQNADLEFQQSANIAAHGPSPSGRYDSYLRHAMQSSSTWSIFGEAIWDITEQLQLDVGARVTWETKDFDFATTYVHPSLAAGIPLNRPINGRFKDDNISPQATLTYNITDDAMIYGAYRTGYKSGGFNASIAQNFATTIADTRFGSERARSFELGTKLTLMDRRLFLNFSVYDTQIKDLQVLAFNAQTISFLAQNAGRLETRGAELELNYDARSGGQGLQLRSAVAYNDAKYADYIGPCFNGQTVAQGCNLNPAPNGAFRSQDFSGKTPPRAPRWTASAGANYSWAMGSLLANAGADFQYTSAMETHDSLSVFGVQKGFGLLNASLSLEHEESGMTLALIGKNLTNRIVSQIAVDVTFSGSGTGTPAGIAADLQGTAQTGRSLALQLTKRF